MLRALCLGQVARLLATERREGGGVFNFDVGSTSATATATARAFSTAASTGVAAAATAAARVATAATAATAAARVAVITVIRRLRRSNAEANVNLLLGSDVLRAFALALHADAAEVQVGIVGVARHELEAFESRAIEHLSFRLLPLSGQGRSLFSLERFGLRERELAGVIHDLRFGFAFIDGVGAELGEFVAGFAPVALTGTATVAIVASTVRALKVASRALAAFAAFAASGATSRAGVTFMIASSALGVEPLAAFGTDNFALEFTSRLRRLGFATVASRGRSDCVRDKQSKRQSSSALDWGLPSSAHCFSRRVARVRGFARARRRPERVNARSNSHSPPCDRLPPTDARIARGARTFRRRLTRGRARRLRARRGRARGVFVERHERVRRHRHGECAAMRQGLLLERRPVPMSTKLTRARRCHAATNPRASPRRAKRLARRG